MEKLEYTHRCARTHILYSCLSLPVCASLFFSALTVSQTHRSTKIDNIFFLLDFLHPLVSERSAAKISFDAFKITDSKRHKLTAKYMRVVQME